MKALQQILIGVTVLFNVLFATAQALPYQAVFPYDPASSFLSSHTMTTIPAPDHGLFIIGDFNGSIDFDPAGSSFDLSTPFGATSVYLARLDSTGNAIWAGQIGNGTTSNPLLFVKSDNAGNLILLGTQDSNMDMDPGSGVSTLADAGLYYFAKYDALGALIYSYSFGVSGGWSSLQDIQGMAVDSAGYIYLSGNFGGTKDMDPTANVFNYSDPTPDGSQSDLFITKLRPNGTHIWTKILDRTCYCSSIESAEVQVGPDGNIYLNGYIDYNSDLDPGPGTWIDSYTARTDPYLIKLDTAGTLIFADIWQNPYPLTAGHNGLIFSSVLIDSIGGIHIRGKVSEYAGSPALTVDYDPGPGTYSMTSNAQDGFILQLNSLGSFVGLQYFGGSGVQSPPYIYMDPSRTHFFRHFPGLVDIDPGPGIFISPASSTTITEVDPTNLALRKVFILGYYGSNPNISAFYDSKGRLIVKGLYGNGASGGIDLDIGPASTYLSGTNFMYLSTLESVPCGGLLIDDVSYAPGSCSTPASLTVTGVGGTAPYTYEWSSIPPDFDATLSTSIAGIYNVTVTDSIGCSRTLGYYLDNPSTTGIDLHPNLIGPDHIPGINSILHLNGYNHGCTPSPATIKLVHEPGMTYLSSTVVPTSFSGDTLIWEITTPFVHGSPWTTTIEWATDTAYTIGDSVHYSVFMTPTAGDTIPSNNSGHYSFVVTTSYDPNDKQVFPGGYCVLRMVEKDKHLDYHIRFQNTGTSQAYNIHILDSLDGNLDLSTFDLMGSSHSVVPEIWPGGVLNLKFDNINLPDSVSDPEGSMGWVSFRIKPLPSSAEGTVITNDVGIYFDYNPPVITNEVWNTLADTVVWHNTILACFGDTVTFPDGTVMGPVTSSLTHSSVFSTPSVCDSTVITHVIVPAPAWVGSDTICSGSTYTFPDGFTSPPLLADFTHVSYFTGAWGCDSNIAITVHPANIDTSVTYSGGTFNATPGGISYQWLDCNAGMSPIAGATGISFTPAASGSYAVAISIGGCTDTSSCQTSFVGITDPIGSPFLVRAFPNPAGDWLNIQSDGGRYTATMFDPLGREVMTAVEFDSQCTINLSTLRAGVYFLRVENWLGMKETVKVVHRTGITP